MSAQNRLQKMQTALEQRGVKDVKFFFRPTVDLGKLTADVSDALSAAIDGKVKPLPLFGDSQRA